MTNNIIYGLVDPFTDELRYIGKSTSGMGRPKEHFKPCNLRNNSYKTNWVKTVLAKGVPPKIIVIQELDDPNALFEAEKYWIAHHRNLGARLTNLTNGGDGTIGYKHHEETIQKLKESALNRDKAAYQNPHNKKPNIIIDGIEYRTCTKCNQNKILQEFSKRTKLSSGFQIYCKSCNLVVNEQWRKENPAPTLSEEEFNKSRLPGSSAGGQATANKLKDPEELNKLKKRMSKPIKATNITTGETLIFQSALEAKSKGFQNTNIGQAIKYSKPYRGYKWEFVV